jgi:cellulose biosynthesis protein BcsQ
MSQSPDLERIMSYFQTESGGAPSRYVEFPLTPPAPVKPLPGKRRGQTLPPPAPPPPTPEPSITLEESSAALSGEWPALDAILGKGRTGRPTSRRQWPTILMTGSVGGTGKTLLLASIGATLALRGRPVIVVDLNGTSYLPFLFIGSHKVSTTRMGRIWTSFFHEGVQIPLLSVRTDGPLSGTTDPGIDLSFSDLYNEIRAEAPALVSFPDLPLPLILVDLDASGRPIFEETVTRAQIALSPVAPEIPSLLAAKEMENYFGMLESGKGIYCERYYIVNRFSGDNPFHAHLRNRFESLLNRRLCPVIIPEDPLLESLLARGEPFPGTLSKIGIFRANEDIGRWLLEKCEALDRTEQAREG